MPNNLEPASSQPDRDEQGIIWVASRVTQPAQLSADDFVHWYETIHVQEGTATGGVPGAVRYESIPSDADSNQAGNRLAPYPWLTVYAFPSLNFRFTDRFRGLDGQKKPDSDVLQKVFSKAAFATRFCGLVYLHALAKEGDIGEQKPAEYLFLVTLEDASPDA